MNERIEKYLEEHLCLYYIGEYGHPVKDPHYEMYREEVEGLIELIVRECVAICQDVDGEDNIDARSGRQDCAVEIRERFGVKE